MIAEITGNIIRIKEPIVTIQDSEEVISLLEEAAQNSNTIILRVENSFSFPSNIIATLERLKDSGKEIKIVIKDEILFELFNDLNLNQSFTIVKE